MALQRRLIDSLTHGGCLVGSTTVSRRKYVVGGMQDGHDPASTTKENVMAMATDEIPLLWELPGQEGERNQIRQIGQSGIQTLGQRDSQWTHKREKNSGGEE